MPPAVSSLPMRMRGAFGAFSVKGLLRWYYSVAAIPEPLAAPAVVKLREIVILLVVVVAAAIAIRLSAGTLLAPDMRHLLAVWQKHHHE